MNEANLDDAILERAVFTRWGDPRSFHAAARSTRRAPPGAAAPPDECLMLRVLRCLGLFVPRSHPARADCCEYICGAPAGLWRCNGGARAVCRRSDLTDSKINGADFSNALLDKSMQLVPGPCAPSALCALNPKP